LQQARELHRAGMQGGAHTVSHPILAGLPSDDVRREIGCSSEVLGPLVGQRIGLFAYPDGKPGQNYDDDAVAPVHELGFDAAVSTAWRAA